MSLRLLILLLGAQQQKLYLTFVPIYYGMQKVKIKLNIGSYTNPYPEQKFLLTLLHGRIWLNYRMVRLVNQLVKKDSIRIIIYRQGLVFLNEKR